MGGERYYSFKKNDVSVLCSRQYVFESGTACLAVSGSETPVSYQICYFHHPLYSDGKFHGPQPGSGSSTSSMFKKYGVNAVFSGHEHVYERLKPQGWHLLLSFWATPVNSGIARPQTIRTPWNLVSTRTGISCWSRWIATGSTFRQFRGLGSLSTPVYRRQIQTFRLAEVGKLVGVGRSCGMELIV